MELKHYNFTEEQLQKKQKNIENRKLKVKVYGLTDAYDLAQLIKWLMVDKSATYYHDRQTDNKIRLQCQEFRSRTIEDLTAVANSYGINMTFKQVAEAMDHLGSDFFVHNHCSTVRKEVHSPQRLTITAKELRQTLGKLNVKNPNYVKPTTIDSPNSRKNK